MSTKLNTSGQDSKQKALFLQATIVVLSAVQIGFVCICLGDGQSVITLKDDADLPTLLSLPIGAGGALVPLTLRQVLFHPYSSGDFAPYGIGPNHDMFGKGHSQHGASSLKDALIALSPEPYGVVPGVLNALTTRNSFSPASFLGCHDLIDALSSAKALCYIALFAAFIQVVVSCSHIVRPETKFLTILTPILQFIIFCGFLLVLILIRLIYTEEWQCDQTLIPSVTPELHFDLAYAIGFVVIGWLASLLALLLSLYIFRAVYMEHVQSTDMLIEQIIADKDAEREVEVKRARDEAETQRAKEIEKLKKDSDSQRKKEVAEVAKTKDKEVQDAISNIAAEKASEVDNVKKITEKQRKAAVAKIIEERQADGALTKAEADNIKSEMNAQHDADLARLRDEKDRETKSLRDQLNSAQAAKDSANKSEMAATTEEKDRKIKELMSQMDGISHVELEGGEQGSATAKSSNCGCRI